MSALTFELLSSELTQALAEQSDTPPDTTARCNLGRDKVMVLVEYPLDSAQAEPLASETLDWLEQHLRAQFDTTGLPEEAADLAEDGEEVAVQLFLKHHSEPKPFTMRSFIWKVDDGFDDIFGSALSPTPVSSGAFGIAQGNSMGGARMSEMNEAPVFQDPSQVSFQNLTEPSIVSDADALTLSELTEAESSKTEAPFPSIDIDEPIPSELDDEYLQIDLEPDAALDFDTPLDSAINLESHSAPNENFLAEDFLSDAPLEIAPTSNNSDFDTPTFNGSNFNGTDFDASAESVQTFELEQVPTSHSNSYTDSPSESAFEDDLALGVTNEGAQISDSIELSLPGEAPELDSSELNLPTVELPVVSKLGTHASGDFFTFKDATDQHSGLPEETKNTELFELTPELSEEAKDTELFELTPELSEEKKDTELFELTPEMSEETKNTELFELTPELSEETGNTELFELMPELAEETKDTELFELTPELAEETKDTELFELTPDATSSPTTSPEPLFDDNFPTSLDIPTIADSPTELEIKETEAELGTEFATALSQESDALNSSPNQIEESPVIEEPTVEASFSDDPQIDEPLPGELLGDELLSNELLGNERLSEEQLNDDLPIEDLPIEDVSETPPIEEESEEPQIEQVPIDELSIDEPQVNDDDASDDLFAGLSFPTDSQSSSTISSTRPNEASLNGASLDLNAEPLANPDDNFFGTPEPQLPNLETAKTSTTAPSTTDSLLTDPSVTDPSATDLASADDPDDYEYEDTVYEAAEYEDDPVYYLEGEDDDEPFEEVALIDDGEVQRQREQWQQQSKGNPWIFAAALGFLVLGLLAYVFSRPCSFSTCDRLQIAQEQGDEAIGNLRLDSTLASVTDSKAQLKRSIRSLQPIPVWSPHYDDAQAILPAYENQVSALNLVTKAQEQAYQAAVDSQNPPHSVATWNKIADGWLSATQSLDAVPADSPVRELADKKLLEYRSNRATILVRVDAESKAEVSLRQSQQSATQATSLAKNATSLADWEEALAAWEAAVDNLSQIPQGTKAHGEAQQILPGYLKQLEEVRERTEQERAASRILFQAKQLAADAQRAETEDQWTLSAQSWKAALSQLQDIPAGTLFHAEAQALGTLYTSAANQAENNLQIALRFQPIEPEFFAACGTTSIQKCTYSVRGGNVRLDLFRGYDNVINESITPPDQRAGNATDAQVASQSTQLLQAITLLSTQAQVPVELYDAKGDFLARYRPDLNGFVREQES